MKAFTFSRISISAGFVLLVLLLCRTEGRYEENDLEASQDNNDCPYGWVQGAGRCYKLYSAAKSIRSAMEVCARQGASLVNIQSWEESDFLSKHLSSYPAIHEWYIGGRLRNDRWQWYTTAQPRAHRGGRKGRKPRTFSRRFHYSHTPVTEDKWFPGWSSQDFMNYEPQEDRHKRCMALSNQFEYPGEGLKQTHYFYWKVDRCTKSDGFNFICQRDIKRDEPIIWDNNCRSDEFRCSNGGCIKGYHKCDLTRHCEDFSDELDCPRLTQLVGSPVPYEGRVQLLLLGSDIAGSVCGDEFDNRDAQVVCRALGFRMGGEVLEAGSFGSDPGMIWMDSLGCNGHENTLDECPYRDHESHTCEHSRDAAVRCFVPPDDVVAVKPKCGAGSVGIDCSCGEDQFQCSDKTCITRAAKCDGDPHCDDGSDEDGCMQLVGGSDKSMGKLVVEMYGENHRFCSDHLGETEANVICRELGYSMGGVPTNMTFLDTGEEALEYNFQCTGTERRLVDCGVAMSRIRRCSLEHLAGVKCTREDDIFNMPDPEVDFQIPFDSSDVDVRMCEDISKVTRDMWDSDTDRFAPNAITLNLQAQLKDFGTVQDQSPEKLFAFVNETYLTRPVYATFLTLLDNFDPYKGEPEILIPQEISEEDAFLDVIMSTPVMKVLYNYLFCKGKVQDMPDLREILRGHWFELYPRSGKSSVLDTSGFEHMAGEFKSRGSVNGMHSWLSLYDKERRGELNYYGHTCGRQANTACAAFEWQRRIKRKASFFVGTSPAYDIAVYSLCFMTHRNGLCPVMVGDRAMNVQTYSKGGHIATAFIV